MTTTKVCPYCGNDTFSWVRKTYESVHIDGNNNVMKVLSSEPVDFSPQEEIPAPICLTCNHKIGAFVEESFYHQTICDDDFEDIVPVFISKELLDAMTSFLSLHYSPFRTYPFFQAESSLYEFFLDVHLYFPERGTAILNPLVREKGVDNPKFVSVQKDKSEVLGLYPFEWEGKKFGFYVLLAEYNDAL